VRLGVPPDRREDVGMCDLVADRVAPVRLGTIVEQSAGDPDLVSGTVVGPFDDATLAESALERVGHVDAEVPGGESLELRPVERRGEFLADETCVLSHRPAIDPNGSSTSRSRSVLVGRPGEVERVRVVELPQSAGVDRRTDDGQYSLNLLVAAASTRSSTRS
jgi:hypothetical protein